MPDPDPEYRIPASRASSARSKYAMWRWCICSGLLPSPVDREDSFARLPRCATAIPALFSWESPRNNASWVGRTRAPATAEYAAARTFS